MIYNWYKIFNLDEFNDADLVSRTVTLFLAGIGQTEIIISKGNTVGVTCNDIFLPIKFDNRNPWAFEGQAVYQDTNKDIWLGFEVED